MPLTAAITGRFGPELAGTGAGHDTACTRALLGAPKQKELAPKEIRLYVTTTVPLNDVAIHA